jgi:hypothetical protein
MDHHTAATVTSAAFRRILVDLGQAASNAHNSATFREPAATSPPCPPQH